MKTIIDQNNDTLAFLQDQDFSSAVKSASLALACHHRRSHFPPPEDINHGASSDGIEDAYDCLDQCMLFSEELHSSEAEGSQEGFIYRHGIMLHPTMAADTTAVTPILVFNSALAYHLWALENHQYQALPKARRLYELAYNAYDMDQNILFQFAVINNILMIDRQVGDDANMSSECLEHLISMFMILVDQGCDMCIRHVQGFLVNILPSNGETAVAA